MFTEDYNTGIWGRSWKNGWALDNEKKRRKRRWTDLTALATQIESEVGAPVSITIKKRKRAFKSPEAEVEQITPIAGLSGLDVIEYKAVESGPDEITVFPLDVEGEESALGDYDFIENEEELSGILDALKKVGKGISKGLKKAGKTISKVAKKTVKGVGKVVSGIVGGGSSGAGGEEFDTELSTVVREAGETRVEEAEGGTPGGETVIMQAEKPFYQTPLGIAAIAAGGYLLLKSLKK